MNLIAKKYPKLVKLHTIGKTLEKKDLIVLQVKIKFFTFLNLFNFLINFFFFKITDETHKYSKKLAFFECGIHSREWISISTAIYMIDTVNKLLI